MVIAIAGPYSANTKEEKKKNLDAMNKMAAIVYERGHIPVIGVNNALPVLEQMKCNNDYNVIMNISLEVVSKCDALLLICESPGANRERDLILSKGLPVYYDINEIPEIKK